MLRLMPEMTQAYLKSLVEYDPLEGCLRWICRRPKIQIGQILGYKHHKGYWNCEIDGKYYAAHRLIWLYMTGSWPKEQIDHVNRDRADNRWGNLREANRVQNGANKTVKNKTGYKGVTFRPRLKENPYEASVYVKKKQLSLGCYPTAKEAYEARCKKAKELHGEFFCP